MMMLKRSRRRHHGPHGWGHRGRTNPTAMTIAALLLHPHALTYLPRRSPPLAIEVSSGRNWSVWRDRTLDKDPTHTPWRSATPPDDASTFFSTRHEQKRFEEDFPLPTTRFVQRKAFPEKKKRSRKISVLPSSATKCGRQHKKQEGAPRPSTNETRHHRQTQRRRGKGIRTQREY